MKAYKWIALIAGAVGYVMGTRAGRARYEQLRRAAQGVMGDPRVREAAQQAKDQAAQVAQQAKGQAVQATDKVRNQGDHAGTTTGTGTGMPSTTTTGTTGTP